ncbi:MAG TPA: aromatic ring-hydroxylating dioxygenase subunit alpha [Nevskiaceae bacterium]|nr:aromatic ring-hydroxylating dioxygenase subunit alpha [Nevskiaceae bacterium]
MNTLSLADLDSHDTAPRDLRRVGLDPDFWYPLARSPALKPGKSLGVNFAGDPIVLVRPEHGEVFALEDRCAHRQVPLHLGVVKGEHLQCGYHCWAYDRCGTCVNVPYLGPHQTLPNGVRSYPAREAYGFVFVFTGDAAKAETVPFPDIPSFASPQYKTRFLNRHINSHYSFMHENLMDMNHQFLHRSLMGGIRTRLLEIREGDDWVEADYTFSRASGKQPIGEWFMINRRKKPDPKREGIDKMTIRTGYPYQTLQFFTAGSREPALDLWNVYMPVDHEQRINQTYGLMMIRKPGIPGLMTLMWPFIIWFTNHIFDQDQDIVEAEQRAHDAQGADWNNEIFPVILKLRALLRRRGVPMERSA